MRHIDLMRNFIQLLAVLAFLNVPALAREPAATQPAVEDGIEVYFSPHGGCTQAVIEQIGKATKTVDMQAYSFTSLDIAKALEAAQARGVKVRVIIDHKASKNQPQAPTYLANHNVPAWTDGKHPIAHSKVIIVDGETVITGSFNFTKQAESNSENLLVITGKPKLAEAYEQHFEEHFSHSVPYQKPD
jgi:phosphatidylserine/phosphatidylglycerophosphate/cardiolipin synthase-like enzyme